MSSRHNARQTQWTHAVYKTAYRMDTTKDGWKQETSVDLFWQRHNNNTSTATAVKIGDCWL